MPGSPTRRRRLLQLKQSRESEPRAPPAGGKTLLVTLCNAAYFPGAVNVLASARDVAGFQGDLAVLVTSDVTACMISALVRLGAQVVDVQTTGWVGRSYDTHGVGKARGETTVHFAKLALVADPRFRTYDTVLYVDSDMEVRASLAPLLAALRPGTPASFVLVGNPNERLYREATGGVSLPAALRQRFPDRRRVHSTRLIALQPAFLPPPGEVAATVQAYIQEYLAYFEGNYEQGLLQLLFYDTVGDIEPALTKQTFEHYYHEHLPWLPLGPGFKDFALRLHHAVGAEGAQCWHPSLTPGHHRTAEKTGDGGR